MPTKSKSKKPRRIPVRTSSCEWPNDLPPLEYGAEVEAEVASSSSLSARALAAEKSLERATSAQEWPRDVWSTDNLDVDSKGKGKHVPCSTVSQGLSLHTTKDDGSEGSDSVKTEASQRTAEGAATLTPKGCEGEQTPVYARSPPKGETSTLTDASVVGRELKERSRRRSDGGLGLVGVEEALGREGMREGAPRALQNGDEDEREATLGSATEISRTPSQSTTGTTDSSNIDSLDTAASSLRSSTSAALHEVKAPRRTSPEPSTESSTVTLTTEVALEDDDDEDKTEEMHEAAVDDNKKLSHLRRYHALMELVETENGYAEDLATLVNVFFANLTSQPFFIEDPSRVEGVVRNTGELLDLHSKLARQLNRIVHDCGLSAECAGSDVEKAADRSEAAVKRIAQRLQRLASRFDVYKHFCARHAEALVLIREAEKRHNGDDFATFERMCGNIVRGGVFTSPTGSMSSRPNSGPSSPNPQALASDVSSFTSSANSSPSLHDDAPPAFARQQTTGRLHFADYLIKPIQRLCLYPLVLNSLLKYTSTDELATRHAIEAAAVAMKKVADSVDDASKQRQREIVSELISTRVEPQQSITQTFLRSLGIPDLAGTVDVLHHNESIRPLLSPLRFEHRGIVLWSGWLLIVKVRKTQQLEPRFWFPLAGVKVSHSEDPDAPFSWPTSAPNAAGHQPIVRHALRLTYGKMHHFELSFSTAKELALWSRELTKAKQARTTDQGLDYPTNLTDFDDGRQVAIRRALERGASPEHRASLALEAVVPEADDALTAFFATHASAYTNVESLVKLWTSSAKAQTNRNMVFTDTVLGAVQGESASQGEGMGPLLLTRDLSEQVIAQQLRQSTGAATPSFAGPKAEQQFDAQHGRSAFVDSDRGRRFADRHVIARAYGHHESTRLWFLYLEDFDVAHWNPEDAAAIDLHSCEWCWRSTISAGLAH
ncbi:Dbl homology domain-containing protein [Acaromyces ingoldii]|uniref:Dbl homology domain-containing protein n=1 Tax=Acaromyces ingoldii TaxID=215250 RepID=A0A316YXE2_9BASI|nr:Dbl homology domain-containing protein [Acaromyces ingoldii]PWN94190.1 Dbl homology domain-containing protein [Acaromyces ingoldii]